MGSEEEGEKARVGIGDRQEPRADSGTEGGVEGGGEMEEDKVEDNTAVNEKDSG